MWKNIDYQHCLSFINCQLSPGAKRAYPAAAIRPSITISRMTGSGGRTIASKLADYLQTRSPVDCRWTVFDRNIVKKMLDDHHLPKRIANFMPEDHKSLVTDTIEELLGLHPSSWTLLQKMAETVLNLARMGYVILVGRGAGLITQKLNNVFHVRLVGSLENRLERVQEVFDLDERDALELLEREDKGRRRYLKDHFGKDVDDPLLYHLVINTDRIRYDDAAQLIGDEVIHRFHLDRRATGMAA